MDADDADPRGDDSVGRGTRSPDGPALTERVICTWCGSDSTEQISAFGPTLMVSSYFCRSCRSPFESIRHRDRP